MSNHASGTFELNWEDLGSEEEQGNSFGRARVTKTFSGDLTGTSVTEIMMVGTPAGPAAYVGIERVDGTLGGRKGGFVLQHSAGSDDGTPETQWMRWRIVPTSGTGELTGIRGEGRIRNDGGAHSYVLDYTLD